MTDVLHSHPTTRPALPGGIVGAMNETLFGPPQPPDPERAAAAARQRHRDEIRDQLDVIQRIAVLVGLVTLEALAAILLLGVILVVY